MEQPAPTMAQNTNDEEEEEIIIDTEEQVVFTLAEVGRRADGDGIDTESPCIGPLRAVQLLKVASQHGVLERLPLTTEQRVLKEKLVAIKAAASSCIEISAVSFFGNLAKRGIAPSARDAAVSDSLCRKTERVFRKRADDLDTSDVRRAGFDLRRLERGFGERKKTGGLSSFSREWQERFKERDAEAHKEWLEQRTRDRSRWARKSAISQFHGDEAGYAEALRARVSTLEEIRDSGTLPGKATGLKAVLVGGYSLGRWCDTVARNEGCIINHMILDHRPLVERLAKLADKDYDALVEGVTRGFKIASLIHRVALTCKKRLDNDWSPVGDDELLKNSNFGKYTIDEEAHKLLHLRNEAIRRGVPVHEAEKVTDWDVISYKPPCLATQNYNASAKAQYIDPSQQKRFITMGQVFTDDKGLKAPTNDQLMTRLAGKHPDSLVSDVHFKEEFVAELRSLGASDEDLELVSQSWGVKRNSNGKYRKYLDESKKLVSMLEAKKRFCPELYPEPAPAPAEALDENWARDARLLLDKIENARKQKKSRLNMEDVREMVTSYGFTGPEAPWGGDPYVYKPAPWPKGEKKFMRSVVAVVQYLEDILREGDAKAGGVGVGVDGALGQFPAALHAMVTKHSGILSWDAARKAIVIHQPDRIEEVLRGYFSSDKLPSFQSQLNNYGFSKDRGEHVYHHFNPAVVNVDDLLRLTRGRAPAPAPSSGLRRGKWTQEEEAYVERIISDFNGGLLDVAPGTKLRSYLSDKLNCDPMRITKKFTGDASIGKRVFHPRENASPAAVERSRREIAELEATWRRKLEQQRREAEAADRKRPAPAPSNLDSDDEKDRNFLDTVYRSSKAEQISGSAPAPAPVALDSSDDDDMRAAKEASYEQFLTEQEAKLYGQIGSSDEQKESGSSSSDEPKYLGTNPPPAVAPVPVAAPAQVEVAEETTPASSPRPPRLTGHAQDVAESEEAKKVERDYDDEAEI